MKHKVRVSKKELKALEKVASIECTGIVCTDCPMMADVLGKQVCVVSACQHVCFELGGEFDDHSF